MDEIPRLNVFYLIVSLKGVVYMVRDCSSDNLTLLTNEVHAFAQAALKLKDILNHFAAFNFRPLPGCNIKTRTKWGKFG